MNIDIGSDGNMALTFPNGHVVSIPWSEKGMAILRRILIENKDVSATKTIGATAAPVQHMIERWLVEDSIRKQEAEAELIEGLTFEL